MGRRLNANVAVGGVWYGPAYRNADRVPEDVAGSIGDHLWDGDEAEAVEQPANESAPARTRQVRKGKSES